MGYCTHYKNVWTQWSILWKTRKQITQSMIYWGHCNQFLYIGTKLGNIWINYGIHNFSWYYIRYESQDFKNLYTMYSMLQNIFHVKCHVIQMLHTIYSYKASSSLNLVNFSITGKILVGRTRMTKVRSKRKIWKRYVLPSSH